ncbi:hypothetical protein BP00DRAFT_12990 [Aspergillus indologenus CBS 114.80]|uniref:Uncharacterized protein n=1 Tax=Aspergillus indologenus CBS 114.80 TaxID=1450541 RepID=A0A2V5HV80_9EURO|nr:hypothetical protein BP00DRAFT_12990 [Aspergillus indologenus CBS 114.80]
MTSTKGNRPHIPSKEVTAIFYSHPGFGLSFQGCSFVSSLASQDPGLRDTLCRSSQLH